MKGLGILRVSVAALAGALGTMLICLLWPSPRTVTLFLGLGLPVAAVGLAVYVAYVLRDLRARRAL